MAKDKPRIYLIASTGRGGALGLSDADLWGLACAIQYGIQTGYFKENPEWARWMADNLKKLYYRS